MNKKEAAIVSAYTGILIGSLDEAHKLAFEGMMEGIKKKSWNDFININIKEGLNENI